MSKSKTRLKVYNSPKIVAIECASLPSIQTGEGASPTADIVAYTGEPMQLKGFAHPVVVDLATLQIPERPTAVLLNHDHDKSVGHSTETRIEENQLFISAALSAATEARREVIDSSKGGFPWGASITVDFGRVKKVSRGATVSANGRDYTGPVNVIYNSRLRETSFVPVGGDINATASVTARVGQGDENMSLEDFAGALGISLDGISEEDMAKLQASYDAMYPAAEEAAAEETAEAEADATASAAEGDSEEEKEEEASAAARPTIQASAAQRTQSQLTALRAITPIAPAVRVSARPDRGRVIQAAMCRRYGISDDVLETDYTADEMTEATSQAYRGYGIKRAFVETLKAAGMTISPYSFGPEHVHMAARATAQASGFSTTSLPNLLGAVANKRLLQQFNIQDSKAVKLMSTDSVGNYQVQTSIRPTMGGDLEEVGTDGEIKHATMGEETYTNQAKIYAKMLQLAEQHIVNDELGGFLKNADRLSRMAFRHREKAFFTLLLGGETSGYYSTANGNLVPTGSTEALSIEALTAARTLFMKQEDSDGDPIDVQPKYLVVPPELADAAHNLVRSVTVNETTSANSPSPDNNPHAGRYEVIESPYMSNDNLTSSSATAWYLFAEPNDVPTYEIVYLNGNQTPVVETETAAFNQLGMQMRVAYRYGIAEADYRGAVKSDGVD